MKYNVNSFWLHFWSNCMYTKTPIKLYYVDWPTQVSRDYPAPDKESISTALVISALALSNILTLGWLVQEVYHFLFLRRF